MKYLKYYMIILPFLFYWVITIFINFPETSVVIGENYSAYNIFTNVIYQKWAFFAPPPKSNERLHYIFLEPNGKGLKIHDFEIFKKFSDVIKDKYLFNDLYVNTTWTVFNYSELMNTNIHMEWEAYKAQHNCESDTCYKYFFQKYKPVILESDYMNFFLDHAKRLAQKAHLPDNCKLVIEFSQADIPKYADRYKPNIKESEKITFTSPMYNLKQNKWEK